jgi:predicted RNA-binding protein with PUA-like domain
MWLVKTEPGTYSYADLEREGRAVWDGVTNPVALRNLRAMQAGELVVVYHTGDERAAVGLARVARAAYPDPRAGAARLVVVDLEPVRRLPAAVPLAALKQSPLFADSPLVRQGRLSVVPLTEQQGQALLEGRAEP